MTALGSFAQLTLLHPSPAWREGELGGLTLLVRGLAPFKPTRLALAVQPVCVKRSLDVNASAHVHGKAPATHPEQRQHVRNVQGGINGLSVAGGCLVAELRQRWR